MEFPKRMTVAGVHFEGRKETIQKYVQHGSNFELERDPDNSYDPNAIKVLLPVRKGSHKMDIGFIPKKYAVELAPWMDAGQEFDAKFSSKIISDAGKFVGLIITITDREAYHEQTA